MFLKVVGFQQKEKKKISFSILGDMTTKNNTKSRFFDQITSFWQKIWKNFISAVLKLYSNVSLLRYATFRGEKKSKKIVAKIVRVNTKAKNVSFLRKTRNLVRKYLKNVVKFYS